MIESTIKRSGIVCDLCKQELPIGTKVGVSFGFPHHLEGKCPSINKTEKKQVAIQA